MKNKIKEIKREVRFLDYLEFFVLIFCILTGFVIASDSSIKLNEMLVIIIMLSTLLIFLVLRKLQVIINIYNDWEKEDEE